MHRRFNIIICTFLLYILCSIQSVALTPDTIHPEQDCVIHIDTKTSLTKGIQLSIYQVGCIDTSSKSLAFTLHSDFSETHVSLPILETATSDVVESVIRILTEESRNVVPCGSRAIDDTGAVSFDVRPGMYLVVQKTEADVQIQPTLVSVPVVNTDQTDWEYEAFAEPKVDVPTPPDNPSTGDMDNLIHILQYSGLLLISTFGCILLFLLSRRNKKLKKN